MPKKDTKAKPIKTIHCMDKGLVFNNHKEVLMRSGEDFNITATNGTRQIIKTGSHKVRYVYSNDNYKPKELEMFHAVKREIRGNMAEKNLQPPNYSSKDIKYFRYSKMLRAVNHGDSLTVKNCLELDIKMAYYVTAMNLGYISKDFFKLCENLPKLQRLRLIGSIATHKQVFVYKAGKLVDTFSKKDDELRKVWFHICHQVDQCMQQFARIEMERFLFYWVDGIYFAGGYGFPDGVGYLEEVFGYDFIPKEIEKIDITCNDHDVLQLMLYKINGEQKPFTLEKDMRAFRARLIEKNRQLLENLEAT